VIVRGVVPAELEDAMKDVVILGAGGFAREVWWALEEMNTECNQWNILGFIDENPDAKGKSLCELPVLGGFEWFKNEFKPQVICGVGGNAIRRRFAEKGSSLGLEFCTVVHPSARLSRFVDLGKGTVVCAGTLLTTQIKIGEHVNLNLDCTVGHDSVIESYCNLSPGVHISGQVRLEEAVTIGTGAVLLPAVRVGHDSVIGAGAVVNKDIPALSLAIGVPAKVVKSLDSVRPAA